MAGRLVQMTTLFLIASEQCKLHVGLALFSIILPRVTVVLKEMGRLPLQIETPGLWTTVPVYKRMALQSMESLGTLEL